MYADGCTRRRAVPAQKSLYRWEINIRMAAILGVVGAGGLGQLLYVSLSLFQQQAFTVIIATPLLVVIVDSGSAWLRRRLVNRRKRIS